MKFRILLFAVLSLLIILTVSCAAPTNWAGFGSSQVVNIYNVHKANDIVTDSWADERGFGQGADLHWKTKGEQNTEIAPEAVEAEDSDIVGDEIDEPGDIFPSPDPTPVPSKTRDETDFILKAIHEAQRAKLNEDVRLLSEV